MFSLDIGFPHSPLGVGSRDNPQLVAKGFDLLCQLVPTAETVAYLTNGASLLSFEETKNSLVAAAGALGRQLIIVECPTDDELGHSFATIVERGAGAVIAGPLIGVSADAIVSLAAQDKIPLSGFPSRGGLMGYGVDFADHDPAPLVPSLITRIRSGCGPVGTGLQTRLGPDRRG